MITLSKKPKNPIVIEGFPGFGLIGTITTEYLIEHLQCEKIGHYYFEHLPATLALHNGEMVSPVTVYHSKKHNIVLIHAITAATGVEWEAADVILDVCKQLNAKEIISLEGVGSAEANGERVFYHSSDKKRAATLEKAKIEALEEGIIVGVTSSLLLKAKRPITCIFAETHSNLPDSKAAATVIKVLDKILGLKVDPQPLLDQAEKFEAKLKQMLEQTELASQEKEKKQLNYVG